MADTLKLMQGPLTDWFFDFVNQLIASQDVARSVICGPFSIFYSFGSLFEVFAYIWLILGLVVAFFVLLRTIRAIRKRRWIRAIFLLILTTLIAFYAAVPFLQTSGFLKCPLDAIESTPLT